MNFIEITKDATGKEIITVHQQKNDRNILKSKGLQAYMKRNGLSIKSLRLKIVV